MYHVLEVQGYNLRAGSERHTAMLARRLSTRDWRVTVAAPPGGLLNDPGAIGNASYLPVSLAGRTDVESVIASHPLLSARGRGYRAHALPERRSSGRDRRPCRPEHFDPIGDLGW